MFTFNNLLKTLLIATIIAFGFEFYIATSMFQQSVGIHQNPDIGRIDAFIEVSKVTEGFWFHMFKGWFYSFSKIFVACALLLAVIKIPNKALNEMDGSVEPPIR